MNESGRGIKVIKYFGRWIMVLPGACLAGILATFSLHWILYSTLSSFIDPYPELPERLLSPLASVGTFVWSGSRIAPEYKFETSLALFGLMLFMIGGFVFLTLSGSDWMGAQLSFRGGGLGTGMAIVGAVTGLYYARKEVHPAKISMEEDG